MTVARHRFNSLLKSRMGGTMDKLKIPREEFSIKVIDGRPVIEIGNTKIHLEIHYATDTENQSFSTVHDDVTTEWDADGEVVWWTISRGSGEPYVEIDPSVTYEEDTDG